MIKKEYLLGLPRIFSFSSSTLLRPRQVEVSKNSKKRASTINLRLIDIGT